MEPNHPCHKNISTEKTFYHNLLNLVSNCTEIIFFFLILMHTQETCRHPKHSILWGKSDRNSCPYMTFKVLFQQRRLPNRPDSSSGNTVFLLLVYSSFFSLFSRLAFAAFSSLACKKIINRGRGSEAKMLRALKGMHASVNRTGINKVSYCKLTIWVRNGKCELAHMKGICLDSV